MKCNICKNKMQKIDTEVNFIYNDKNIKAINVPTLFCHSCSKTMVPDLINKKLQEYASQHKGEIIDFKKCSDKENEDAIIAVNMIWNM